MKIYSRLSKINLLKRYSYKFLFVAFIGIHIPLIGIITFIVATQGNSLSSTSIIVITLILTLLATGATLFFLDQLLAPLTNSKIALENYVERAELPDLPTEFYDEAGILMQQLQATLLKLDELVKAKDELVSVISHDIRTPLSHIINYAELLKLNNADEKVTGYADKIIASGNHQLAMFESLLKLLQQQGMTISEKDKTNVVVIDLVNEILNQNESLITTKNLNINVNIDNNISIRINENLFSHALQNLIHNACKFSNSGGHINISARLIDGDKTEITISDDGIGFTPEFSEDIFDKFTHKGQTGTFGEPSTGLGLYLSKTITEKHLGNITAQSNGPGKGAKFVIVLPN
ncbi:MAG: HAMP domain-containing histidine kinase [Bacteroidetes bacterium]|nr:HAMP domain-containing histidine kinase [Bacteroidota bacterium]